MKIWPYGIGYVHGYERTRRKVLGQVDNAVDLGGFTDRAPEPGTIDEHFEVGPDQRVALAGR